MQPAAMKWLIVLHVLLIPIISSAASSTITRTRDEMILPMWKAPWEKSRSDARRSSSRSSSSRWLPQQVVGGANLPDGIQIRFPAEYEPVASVLFSFEYFRNETVDIASQLLYHTTDVDIFMLNGPEDLFDNDDNNNNEQRYKPIPFSSESVWTRDYGPVGVLVQNKDDNGDDEEEESLALINMRYRWYLERPDDNAIPCSVASLYEDWPCYEMELIVDGGNLMSDGVGNLFTTTRTYDWNPDFTRDQVDDILKKYFGVETIHALDYARAPDGSPLDKTGHIDMFAKIVEPCKVIVAETDSPVFDEITQGAADYFANLACSPSGETYQVFPTKAWSTVYEDEWGEYTVWYTYTNSLIVNDVIVIPGYEGAFDEETVAVYQAASPNRTILQTNTDTPILYAGAVHCITRQLPVAINSPSMFEMSIPNVTCFDANVTSPPSCSVDDMSAACQEHYPELQFAITGRECGFNALFVELMCCTEAADRLLVLPEYPEDQLTHTIQLEITLDHAPMETAWVILNSTGNKTLASSPFYDLSQANSTVKELVYLPPGVYIFVMMDEFGDGNAECCHYVDNLSNGDYLVYVESFELYYTSTFVVREDGGTTTSEDGGTTTSEDGGTTTSEDGDNGVQTATGPPISSTGEPEGELESASAALSSMIQRSIVVLISCAIAIFW